MGEILVAPDAAGLMIAWLTSELPTIPDQTAVGVYRDPPSPRESAFVVVHQDGGPGRDGSNVPLDRALLTIDAYARTARAASDLAQNARAVAHAARGVVHSGVQVYRVEDGGAPVDLPDPLTSNDSPDFRARFRFIVQLTVRIRRPAGA